MKKISDKRGDMIGMERFCSFKCDSYLEFFSVLKEAIDDGDEVRKADNGKMLMNGFVVNGTNRYLMGVVELKHAQMNGIDVSAYMDLKHVGDK